MVFSSYPLYLDPPNWQYQQQQGGGNEISSTNNTMQHHQPLQQPSAATGGSKNIRPGSMTDRARMAKVPLPETALKCPRCESTNTKFCYFNNYSLTQPRHFCKTCRRYWTRGGALRTVPVGGGCRRATKQNNKRRSKGPAVQSGTAIVTTTTSSTDQALVEQNVNNMSDGSQFVLYPQGGINKMGSYGLCDQYMGGGNMIYGGAQTDPHIAKLFQTGHVMSLGDGVIDQWSRLDETASLTQMHSSPFPLLTNMAQREPSSQRSGLLYQFDQRSGGHLGLSGSSIDSLGNFSASNNALNMFQIDGSFGTQFTNVKMEDGESSRRSLEMRNQAAASNRTSMAYGNSQSSMVGNQNIGHTWIDPFGFTSNAPSTCHDGL